MKHSAVRNTSIAQRIRTFVSLQYQSTEATRYVFHSFHFAEKLAAEASSLAAAEEVNPRDVEMVEALAWIIPAGHLQNNANPQKGSQELLDAFYSQEDKSSVPPKFLETLANYLDADSTSSKAAQVLHDAMVWAQYGDDFEESSALRKLEQELVGHQSISQVEWSKMELSSLLGLKFLTPFAQSHFMPLVHNNIINQRVAVEKIRKKNPIATKGSAPFQHLSKKNTASGIQTFFRANFRNHINLSEIADRKAHIMISVNAIIISVIVSVLSYRNITEVRPMIILPVVIFIICGLISLVFAVLSSRPKINRPSAEDLKNKSPKDFIFFGNFAQLKVEEFEAKMDELFQHGDQLYQGMIRDLYFLGKVLDQKYRYLSISYNIFMAGFIATVIAFLITLAV